MTFNIADRIKQVREVEARIEAMEAEFDAKLKPFVDFANKARVQILEYLNESGQKSAKTEFGTAHWYPKITYRVADRDEFRRHVIGTESWDLIGWSAANTICEEFTQSHGETPPGLVRNAVSILSIKSPPKPRSKTKAADEVEEDGVEEVAEADAL